MMITSGGPTHMHMLPMGAAGIMAIITVGCPGGITGPPTCGMGGMAGVSMGHMCMSPTRAAGIGRTRCTLSPFDHRRRRVT